MKKEKGITIFSFFYDSKIYDRLAYVNDINIPNNRQITAKLRILTKKTKNNIYFILCLLYFLSKEVILTNSTLTPSGHVIFFPFLYLT